MDLKQAIGTNWNHLLTTLRVEPVVSYLNERNLLNPALVKSPSDLLICVISNPRVEQAFIQALAATKQQPIVQLLTMTTSGTVVFNGVNVVQIGNNSVMNVVGGTKPERAPVTLTRKPVFRQLIDSVKMLAPGSVATQRHGTINLTGTGTYTDPAPVSNLGAREIPYLFAALGCQYAPAAVLAWEGAPSKAEFNRSYAIYKSEVSEAFELIEHLNGGGIHLVVDINDSRFEFLQKIIKGYLHLDQNRRMSLVIEKICTDNLSVQEQQLIGCLIHLMCFSNHRFVARRSFAPKPSCYLLFQAAELVQSPVVFRLDAPVVNEAVRLDESVAVAPIATAPRPW